jgi:hypothetical protein
MVKKKLNVYSVIISLDILTLFQFNCNLWKASNWLAFCKGVVSERKFNRVKRECQNPSTVHRYWLGTRFKPL